MSQVVKFIVAEGKVYLGEPQDEWHVDVARRYNIPIEKVDGGGRADIDAKKIFGTSTTFGPYDAEVVRKNLPDWEIEDSKRIY